MDQSGGIALEFSRATRIYISFAWVLQCFFIAPAIFGHSAKGRGAFWNHEAHEAHEEKNFKRDRTRVKRPYCESACHDPQIKS